MLLKEKYNFVYHGMHDLDEHEDGVWKKVEEICYRGGDGNETSIDTDKNLRI